MRGAFIIYTLLIFIGVNLLTNICYSSITYDSGSNTIIIVGDSVCGNSSSNPCTFEDIYQADVSNGWGVVSKQGNNQYEFRCKLQIGDGTNETWLVDANKMISHTIDDDFIYIPAHGHFRCGIVVDEANRITKDGCCIYTNSSNKNIIKFANGGIVELYSTTISAESETKFLSDSSDSGYKIWNCNFIRVKGDATSTSTIPDVDFYRVNWQSAEVGPTFTHTNYSNDILISDCKYAISCSFQTPVTIKNYRVVGETYSFLIWTLDADLYAINIDCKWNILWLTTNAPGKIYRQYTFNLKVVDAEGNPIPDARVKIWNNAGNLVVNETTDSNGRIPEQILTYGYYDEDHGSTPVMITPHTIRIYHQDYPPKEFQFVADEPIDWTISLKDRPKSSGIIQVYGTEYYPGEEGIIYAQLLYGDGTPANNAVCNVTIWNKDNMLVSNQQMKHITNSNGMYYYNFTVPDDISVFLADVVCENPTAYGSAEFHVSNIDEIAKRVWNYTERTLTDYNESSIAYAVWNYTNRTLTSWNFTQGYIADYDVAELVYPGKEWKATLTITTIDGFPVDADKVVVKIYDPSQTLVLTKNMSRISTGAYMVEWSVPASPALGLYQTFAEVYKDGSLITKKYKVFRVAQTGPADIRVTALQKYIKKGENLPIKIEIKNAGGIGTDFQISYWIEKDSGSYEETTETIYVAGGETKTIYRDIYVPMIVSKGSAWIKAKAFYDPSQPEAYSQDTFYISEGISEERGGGFTFAPTEPTKYPLIIIVSAPRPVDIYIYGCNNTLIKKIPHATGIVTEFLDEGKYIIKYVYDGKAALVSINLDRPRYITLSFQKTQEAVDIYPFIFGVVAVIASGIVFYLIIKRFRRSYISTDLSLRGFELHYEK